MQRAHGYTGHWQPHFTVLRASGAANSLVSDAKGGNVRFGRLPLFGRLLRDRVQIGGLQQLSLAELIALESSRPTRARAAAARRCCCGCIRERAVIVADAGAAAATRRRRIGTVCPSSRRRRRLVAVHGRRVVAGQQTTVAVHCRLRAAHGGQLLRIRRHIRQAVLERDGALVLLDLLVQFAVLPDAVLQIGHLRQQPRPARRDRGAVACPAGGRAFRSVPGVGAGEGEVKCEIG